MLDILLFQHYLLQQFPSLIGFFWCLCLKKGKSDVISVDLFWGSLFYGTDLFTDFF